MDRHAIGVLAVVEEDQAGEDEEPLVADSRQEGGQRGRRGEEAGEAVAQL